nr:uncharacterized protein LOC123766509 [Procambarus clarkii]XP_045611678.1 uncharacterized protein LOC123766509 [Procambarus clarkii]
MRGIVAMVVLVTLLQVNQALVITKFVNLFLQNYLNKISDPWELMEPLSLDLNVDYMADMTLTMNEPKVEGVTTFNAYNCTTTNVADGKMDIVLNFAAPQLTLSSAAYIMNGTLVDHINLEGRGPAEIVIENLDINIEGKGFIDYRVSSFYLNFDNASLNLEMRRWTVNFEGVMPGTDLGTLFNEFFSAHGQELLDMLEIRISNGKLVDFINGLFERSTSSPVPTTSSGAPSTPVSTAPSTPVPTASSGAPSTPVPTASTAPPTPTAPATEAFNETIPATETSLPPEP